MARYGSRASSKPVPISDSDPVTVLGAVGDSTATSTIATTAAAAAGLPAGRASPAVLKRRRLRSDPKTTTTREGGQEGQEKEEEEEEIDGIRIPEDKVTMAWTTRNQWIVYAIASGACAACNGVFAKLTTNDLTTQIGRGIARALGLGGYAKGLEILVRVMFFGLNLAFNGVMWTLFTKALARGTSTTQVSIMNTSTNFVITALLGLAIFAESLPPLWWIGAVLLIAGNVIIGRKKEGEDGEDNEEEEYGEGEREREEGDVEVGWRGGGEEAVVLKHEGGEEEEDVPLLGDLDGPGQLIRN
ncbi:hypothetical protein GGR50DRAFT_35693 [Xylaria sp. CBS 124048]|nr:hypothetical protein GGR50DRAFT_35693 [Xylaria sp. CBS 124048]